VPRLPTCRPNKRDSGESPSSRDAASTRTGGNLTKRAKAPKLKALRQRKDVAVTIDGAGAWPYKALLVRGTATVDVLDNVAPEYIQAADRYFGCERGAAWLSQLQGQPMAGVAVTPTWAAVLDFETRFPSALSA
jgi:hypothetical protein